MNIFINIGFEENEPKDTILQVHKPDGTVDDLTLEKGAAVIAIKPGETIGVANLGAPAAPVAA